MTGLPHGGTPHAHTNQITSCAAVSDVLAVLVQVVIPDQCLLNPSPEAAVVGGNVLTSQRVTDVVLKAFGAAAASQVQLQ